MFVTFPNIARFDVALPNVISIKGDARGLKLGNASFDVVFLNSVIEHVGIYDDQILMAREVARVGRRYFIQTPYRNFPLEPHFLFSFVQFLPMLVRIWLQNFNLGWFNKTPDIAASGIGNIRGKNFWSCKIFCCLAMAGEVGC